MNAEMRTKTTAELLKLLDIIAALSHVRVLSCVIVIKFTTQPVITVI